MKRLWEVMLSAFLWGMSWLHFLIVVPVLIALAVVLDIKPTLALADLVHRGVHALILRFSTSVWNAKGA